MVYESTLRANPSGQPHVCVNRVRAGGYGCGGAGRAPRRGGPRTGEKIVEVPQVQFIDQVRNAPVDVPQVQFIDQVGDEPGGCGLRAHLGLRGWS